MEDLTHIFRDMGSDPITALAPTSQSAGNQRHDNSLAQTAPGTVPASPVNGTAGEITDHEPPEIHAEAYDTPVLRDPDGSHVNPDANADRGTSYTRADGSGWNSSTASASPVPAMGRRSMLRRGEWNNI